MRGRKIALTLREPGECSLLHFDAFAHGQNSCHDFVIDQQH